MSDIMRVVRDTKRGAKEMSEAAVLEARNMLEALMLRHHRGPADTWTAARDRTAKDIGLEPSYAKRIWQRWQDMKDVSGGAYRALKIAYDAQCSHNEAMAAHHRAIRKAIEDGRQTDEDNLAADLGMASADDGSPEAPARSQRR